LSGQAGSSPDGVWSFWWLNKKFHRSLLGESSSMAVTDIDVKDYVKFLLKEGTLEEKRDVMGCFKSVILLKNNQVFLKKVEE
jgi:hypothetical protein